MASFFEEVIKTYSGLSSETKPTIAAGNNVLNGSRWREVDTNDIYIFNLADDAWYEIKTIIAAKSLPAIPDYFVEVQRGNVSGATMVHKFGRNDSVPDGAWQFVALSGFTDWPLSAPTTVRIKAGGNAADDAGGNGAREITVLGINDSFNEVSEAIATAGALVSADSIASFWRIYSMWVSAAGTYGGANTGEIVLEVSAGLKDLIRIATNEGESQFGGWTCPTGKTAYLLGAAITADSKKVANVKLYIREDIDDTTAPMKSKRIKLFWDGVADHTDYHPRSPVMIPEKSDIWFEAYGDGAVNQVSVDFELLVIDN